MCDQQASIGRLADAVPGDRGFTFNGGLQGIDHALQARLTAHLIITVANPQGPDIGAVDPVGHQGEFNRRVVRTAIRKEIHQFRIG